MQNLKLPQRTIPFLTSEPSTDSFGVTACSWALRCGRLSDRSAHLCWASSLAILSHLAAVFTRSIPFLWISEPDGTNLSLLLEGINHSGVSVHWKFWYHEGEIPPTAVHSAIVPHSILQQSTSLASRRVATCKDKTLSSNIPIMPGQPQRHHQENPSSPPSLAPCILHDTVGSRRRHKAFSPSVP